MVTFNGQELDPSLTVDTVLPILIAMEIHIHMYVNFHLSMTDSWLDIKLCTYATVRAVVERFVVTQSVLL